MKKTIIVSILLLIPLSTLLSQINIEFREGWNISSLNLRPADFIGDQPEVDEILEPILENLIMVRNKRGRFYTPRAGFNNIPYWNALESYRVKVDEDVNVEWENNGLLFPAQTQFIFGNRFNRYVPYLPDYELDASAPDFYVLSPIIDRVIFAKDRNGNFMAPEYEFSNMPPWSQGYGYYIHLNGEDAVDFSYPEEEEFDFFVIQPGDHWDDIEITYSNMSLLVSEFIGFEPAQGDQIAAFDSEDQIVGVGTINENQCGLAIIEMEEDSAFYLKYWSEDRGREFLPEVELVTGQMRYQINSFTVLTCSPLTISTQTELPVTLNLLKTYPNPFNVMLSIEFTLTNDEMHSVKLFDLNGNPISELSSGTRSAGTHILNVDFSDLASGEYIVHFKSSNGTENKKVVLLK